MTASVTAHDPLCPFNGQWPGVCHCDLIARVRAEEWERRQADMTATAKWCREDERATLREQVQANQDAFQSEALYCWVLALLEGGAS